LYVQLSLMACFENGSMFGRYRKFELVADAEKNAIIETVWTPNLTAL